MRKLPRVLVGFGFAAAMMIASSAQATLYDVNRFFTAGGTNATLTGTLDIPTGNYVIQNASVSPFTTVNLTLTVNAASFNLDNALTGFILGNGQFFIDATPTTLTFSTANADVHNPADLVFSDNSDPSLNNRYSIGYNGIPGFEVAYTDAGSVVTYATLPTVFGTAIPEPGSFALVGLSIVGLLAIIRRRR
jgi:PEP-CTERM motif